MKLVFALIVTVVVASANGLGEKSPEVIKAAVQSAGKSALEVDALSGRSIREPAPGAKQETTQAHPRSKGAKKGKGKKAAKGKGAKKGANGQKKGKSAAHGGKKKSKGGNKKAKSGKKKAKGGKKKAKGGKKKAKSGKKKAKNGKKGKSHIKLANKNVSTKMTGAARQTTTCGVADVVAAIKKFTLYTTNLNQNKRIRGFMSLAQQKMSKAPTTFVGTAGVISDATGGGQSCNGGAPNSTVTMVYNKLTNCSQTAVAACNMTLSAADNATVTSCAASLENYTKAFQACVASGSCSCFQSLVSLPSCENMTTILTPVTAAKNKCVSTSNSGSFADCRQQQIAAIPFTTGCKCPGPMSTGPTTMTTKAVGRLFRSRDFLRFNKINL